jgi:hypothetical protein
MTIPSPERVSIWVPIKLVVVPLAAIVVTRFAERNASSAEAFGYWTAIMLIPFLVALAVVRFKPLPKMRTFSTVFCLVGLIGMAMMLVSSLTNQVHGQQKTAQELAQEASGVKPVTESSNPSERKTDRVLREFLADVLAARKKHDADAAPLAPVLATLYTAPSFSDKQKMGDVIATLKKILEIDGEMTSKFERLPEEFKKRVDTSDLNASEKEDVVRGFEKGYGGSQVPAAYHELRTTEALWGASALDLYTFSLEHASAIKIVNQKIVIADHDLLNEFNAKFSTSRDLRDKIREGNQRLVALQAAASQKSGITKSDLGLK